MNPNTRPVRAALYARVSSEEQREQKSIGAQLDYAEGWFKLQGVTPVALYRDDGVSGTLPAEARPESARLLADARAGKFDVVYVYMLDRLGRHPRHILNCVAMLEECGVRIVSMTEPFDTATPAGRLMLTMLSAIAGFARDVIVERSVDGRYAKFSQGVWVGGKAPYGYELVDRWPEPRETPAPGQYLSEAGVIRLIYQRLAEECSSCCKIALELTALGIPSPRAGSNHLHPKTHLPYSGRWAEQTIRRLVHNPLYKGEVAYGHRGKHGREVRRMEVTPLVDTETWERAQAQIRDNFLHSRRNTKREYLLRGLVKCGVCGESYYGWANMENRVYYICAASRYPRANYEEACGNAMLPGGAEEIVWGDLQTLLLDPGTARKELTALQEREREEPDGAALDQIEAALAANRTRRERIFDLYERGHLASMELDGRLATLEEETAALYARQRELQRRFAEPPRLDGVEGALRELSAFLQQPMPFERRRKLIELLVERIEVRRVPNWRLGLLMTTTFRVPITAVARSS